MVTTRLRRLEEKETRRLIAVILGGKMLGIAAVLAAMWGFTYFLGTPAGAMVRRTGFTGDLPYSVGVSGSSTRSSGTGSGDRAAGWAT